jgi:hypothetical protein
MNLKERQGHRESPVRRDSTWIKNQREEPRAFIELRGNPVLFIT